MKKIISGLLVLSMLFTLAGCSGASEPGNTQENSDNINISTPLSTNASSADENSLSSIAVGDTVKLGGSEWTVLELKDGKALILSDKVLFKRAMHSSDRPITWAECELREYMNGEFYDSTFSEDEKARIIETTISTADNPWFPTENPEYPWYSRSGGADTKDKIFLLSIQEIAQFFGSSDEIEDRPVGAVFINDQYNDVRIAETAGGDASWWWLRSPGLFYSACGANFNHTAAIAAFGALNIQGEFVNNRGGGVRPALWLEI